MSQELIIIDATTTFSGLTVGLERVLHTLTGMSTPVFFGFPVSGASHLCIDRSVTGYSNSAPTFALDAALVNAPVLSHPEHGQRLFAYLKEQVAAYQLGVAVEMRSEAGLVWAFTTLEQTRTRGIWGNVNLHLVPHGYEFTATLEPDDSSREAVYRASRSFGGPQESAALARLILACLDQTSLAGELLALAEERGLLTKDDGHRAAFETYQGLPFTSGREEEAGQPTPSSAA